MGEWTKEEAEMLLTEWTPPDQGPPPGLLMRCSGLRREKDRERLRNALERRALWFADPRSFDDPFDCNPAADGSTWHHDVRTHAIREGRRDYGLEGADLIGFANRAADAMSDMTDKEREEKRAGFQADIRNSLGASGVVCFCGDLLAPLIWSQYAEGHRGVGVCYRTEPLTKAVRERWPIATWLKVTYSSKRPLVGPFEVGPEANIRAAVCTKDEAWGHQKEWRLFIPPPAIENFGDRQLEGFPEESIAAIILGCSITDDDAKRVRSYCEAHGIRVLSARESKRDFRIEIPGLSELRI